jgi:hypothetical protein
MGDSTSQITEKYYSNLKKNVRIEKSTDGNVLELDWIDEIEKAVPYIDNIFENPKRFIISEEEILNIEKSKKVGVATVKHLSKHTNFISEVDEETGDIKPEKLLNELKEETFNTYENRFIYTLVDLMDSFVRRMEEKMESLNYSKNNTFESNSETNVMGEEVKCSVRMVASKKVDSLDNDDDTLQRIKVIKSNINSWKMTGVYTSLKKEKAAKVKSPLNRTNVLKKNPNFKIAASLWDYLNAYREQEEENEKHPDTINSLEQNLQNIIDNSSLMYYLIMKMSTTKNKYQIENYNRLTKEAAMNMMKQTTEMLMDSDTGITKQDLVDAVSDTYNEVKYKKMLDASLVETKIKNLVRNYIDKVDGSYFELENGDSNEK